MPPSRAGHAVLPCPPTLCPRTEPAPREAQGAPTGPLGVLPAGSSLLMSSHGDRRSGPARADVAVLGECWRWPVCGRHSPGDGPAACPASLTLKAAGKRDGCLKSLSLKAVSRAATSNQNTRTCRKPRRAQLGGQDPVPAAVAVRSGACPVSPRTTVPEKDVGACARRRGGEATRHACAGAVTSQSGGIARDQVSRGDRAQGGSPWGPQGVRDASDATLVPPTQHPAPHRAALTPQPRPWSPPCWPPHVLMGHRCPGGQGRVPRPQLIPSGEGKLPEDELTRGTKDGVGRARPRGS